MPIVSFARVQKTRQAVSGNLAVMNRSDTATLPILPAGQHTAMDGRLVDITPAMLEAMASHYNRDLAEAPLVVGHPKHNAPAYGWVKSLQVRDGMLYAEPHQVYPAFAEAVNTGRWKKRSASFYLPDTPGNPLPGQPYLRHVGFLGAQPPAIKGMPDITLSFAEQDDAIAIEFAEPDSGTPEGVDPVAASAVVTEESGAVETLEADAGEPHNSKTESEMAQDEETTTALEEEKAQLAAQKEDLDQREQRIAEREAQLAAEQATEQRNEAVAYAEQLVSAGKLLPRQQGPVVELLLTLPGSQPLSFSEGGESVSKPAQDVLRELLDNLPKQVDFAEKSSDDGEDHTQSNVHDTARQAADYQAQQKAAGRHISTTEAVNHIRKGGK